MDETADKINEFLEGCDLGKVGASKRDPASLKELALALSRNEAMLSTQIPEEQLEHLARSIFMPLIFLNDEQRQSLIDRKIVAFYGFMRDAGPRSINGWPMFGTVGYLTLEEHTQVVEMARKLREAEKAALDSL